MNTRCSLSHRSRTRSLSIINFPDRLFLCCLSASHQMYVSGCKGTLTDGVCWISVVAGKWPTDLCVWGLYLGWLVAFYVYAVVGYQSIN